MSERNINYDLNGQEEFLNRMEMCDGKLIDVEEMGISFIPEISDDEYRHFSFQERVSLEHLSPFDVVRYEIPKTREKDEISNQYKQLCEIREKLSMENYSGSLILLMKGEYITGAGTDKRLKGRLVDNIVVIRSKNTNVFEIVGTLSSVDSAAKINYGVEESPKSKSAFLKNGAKLHKMSDYDYSNRDISLKNEESFRKILATHSKK